MSGTGEALRREIDAEIASVARIYDYALGGKVNFPVDREAFDRIEAVAPSTRPLAANNRRFLARMVRVLVEDYGVRQFIDHGSGLPTEDNVHQVAQRVDPGARVVYVDHDPTVLAYGRELLADDDNTAVVLADFRDAEQVFDHPDVRRLIDLAQPVAALFVSVLHCVPDADDPAGLLRRVVERLPSGSILTVNQLVSDDAELRDWASGFMSAITREGWGRVRQRHEVAGFFDGLGLELLPPGLVEISTWRPDSSLAPKQLTDEWIEFGGVALKP